MNYNKLLVIIEPESDHQPALEKAVQLAKFAGAELELMISDYNTYLDDGYYFEPVQAQKLRYEHGEQQMHQLETLAQPLRDGGLEVSVVTAWANPPYREIVERTRSTKPDLVIKSTRHHHKLSRLFLSNEDWELVRYCPAPLLLTKDKSWTAAPVFLAAVDPDHLHDKPAALDEKILQSAKSLAEISGGAVHLYHSSWVPPLSGVYPVMADPAEEQAKLNKFSVEHGVASENCHWSNVEIVQGMPEVVAEAGASVVVMGAISRSRLDRILIGNTAERVLDKLECDVLVVKPDNMPAMNTVLL